MSLRKLHPSIGRFTYFGQAICTYLYIHIGYSIAPQSRSLGHRFYLFTIRSYSKVYLYKMEYTRAVDAARTNLTVLRDLFAGNIQNIFHARSFATFLFSHRSSLHCRFRDASWFCDVVARLSENLTAITIISAHDLTISVRAETVVRGRGLACRCRAKFFTIQRANGHNKINVTILGPSGEKFHISGRAQRELSVPTCRAWMTF